MKRLFVLSILVMVVLMAFPASVGAQEMPVVRAVLFYSPTCPHCHTVITESLPPLLEQYQEQLEIIPIDVSTQGGQALYQAYLQYFNVPDERRGVPALIVGDVYMVGSVEIPELFPGIIAEGLDSGGINWTPIPELIDVLVANGIIEEGEIEVAPAGPGAEQAPADPQPAGGEASGSTEEVGASAGAGAQAGGSGGIGTGIESVQSIETMTVAQRFAQDVLGNSISVIVLLGLVGTIVVTGNQVFRTRPEAKTWPIWVIPVMVVIGLMLAAYMAYIEMSEVEAVCGPVGDCGLVHASKYAYLFGFFPVGVFGFMGYLAIGWTWFAAFLGKDKFRKYSALVLFGLALFGVLFSTYLTFLEPFVIGATCMWCLASAINMILILWAAVPMALEALAEEQEESFEETIVSKEA